MEETTINQRLKFLIASLGLTAKAFSNAISESPTTTHNYTSERNAEPRARYLAKTLSHFANLNARWLMTGEGEPFPSDVPIITQSQKKNTGNVVGSISGGKNKFTTLSDCEVANANLRQEVARLEAHLADKERLIQDRQEIIDLLKAQQKKP